MGILKNEIMRTYNMRPSTTKRCMEILEMIDSIAKTEYERGFADGRKPQWIPFKLRPLTEEEQEEHSEWDCILDCKLPDDGQEILVTYDINGRRGVWYDEFCSDDGSYLDSGKEIGEEVIAWMPLPEPWRGEEHETTL